MRKIVQVAILRNIRKNFDYLIDLNNKSITINNLKLVGCRVLVPFGKKTEIAIIINIKQTSEVSSEKLKSIKELIDTIPFFDKIFLNFIYWAADYYFFPIGEVFNTAIPKNLKLNNIEKLKKNEIIKHKKNNIDSDNNIEYINKSHKNQEAKLILNNNQKIVFNKILDKLNYFNVFLLNGVTGSGKTEIYLQIVEEIVNNNKQAIVLIPEIGLTPQTLQRFNNRFPNKTAIYHSKISPKKKSDNYLKIKSGKIQVIIGTRSAIWVQLKNPGVFIIDEEHDSSFKQHSGLKYSARDLLIKRAQMYNCPIILGSATPSLESINNVINNKYTELILPTRAGNSNNTDLTIIDTKNSKQQNIISEELITKINNHLQNNNQVLLFLNRRGFARVLICYDCGWVKNCPNCDTKMVIHYSDWKLKCHYCNKISNIPKICPSCKLSELDPVGVGTEKIELGLKQLFPVHKIARVDRDTIKNITAMHELYNSIHNREIDLLIGTQMLAKGHHFPNITLAAILDLDSGLFGTDFRAGERLGQLFTQVSGRSGRGNTKGEVVLQTCHPENPLLKILTTENYQNFSKAILQQRKDLSLPPFSFQALITTKNKDNSKAVNFLNWVRSEIDNIIKNLQNISTMGPVASPIAKKLGLYRNQLLIQAKSRRNLHYLLNLLVPIIENNKLSNSCNWDLEIDPQDFL